MQVRRNTTVGQHPACCGRDQTTSQAASSGRFLGDDSEFLADPIVDLDPHASDRRAVVIERNQAGAVEWRKPLRQAAFLLFEPLTHIVDVGIHLRSRPKDTCSEAGGSNAQDGTDLVAETLSLHSTHDRHRDRVHGIGWNSNDGSDAIADTLQQPDRAVPSRRPPSFVPDDVNARSGWRPLTDP
jgi:hypothetical protein